MAVEIPKHPCYTCSYCDMLTCTNCFEYQEYEKKLSSLSKKYSPNILFLIKSISEKEGEIEQRKLQIGKLKKQLEGLI